MTPSTHSAPAPPASSISVVIPVYGGADTLEPLLDRLAKVFTVLGLDHEVVLVNDASPDGSWSVIEKAVDRYPWVRGIDLMKNSGQHNALLCGVRAARYDTIVTLDDDLQHPPECIPDLLAKLAEGYDLVYGVPFQEKRSFIRNLMSRMVKRVVMKYGAGQEFEISSLRVFRTSLRDAFTAVTHPSIYLDFMLSWGARRIGQVRVAHDVRRLGASVYTPARLVRHALNMLTSFSVLPLHVASWLGFLVAGFGFLVLFFTFADFFLHGRAVPGFAFLSSIMAIFSGAQLFSVGILGLYLARIYEGTMAKPAYVVRQEIGHPAQPAGRGENPS